MKNFFFTTTAIVLFLLPLISLNAEFFPPKFRVGEWIGYLGNAPTPHMVVVEKVKDYQIKILSIYADGKGAVGTERSLSITDPSLIKWYRGKKSMGYFTVRNIVTSTSFKSKKFIVDGFLYNGSVIVHPVNYGAYDLFYIFPPDELIYTEKDYTKGMIFDP